MVETYGEAGSWPPCALWWPPVCTAASLLCCKAGVLRGAIAQEITLRTDIAQRGERCRHRGDSLSLKSQLYCCYYYLPYHLELDNPGQVTSSLCGSD